jgi:hypothetical protein
VFSRADNKRENGAHIAPIIIVAWDAMRLSIVALRHDCAAIFLSEIGSARNVELKRLENIGLIT